MDALVVSIDPTDSVAKMRDYRRAAGSPPYPMAWDRTGALASDLQVAALGTSVVYDARGRVVFRGIDSDPAAIASAVHKAGAS